VPQFEYFEHFEALALDRRLAYLVGMKLTIGWFRSEGPAAVQTVTQDFASLKEARMAAFGSADTFEACFVRIDSDDGETSEHWGRDGDDWKRKDA
jgi:hypothetical protein